MGLYRDENGSVFETDDTWARSQGYTPVSPAEEQQGLAAQGLAARGTERGFLGTANAGLTSFASGLTLGGTDALLAATLDPAEREQVLAELHAHPVVSGVSNLIGAVAPAFAAPESLVARTPTGYLAKTAAKSVESALAEGGAYGTAKALSVMGAEGAAQSGGAYIGHTALEDKDVTAEGLAGALGTGFEFGVGGGAGFLGVEKGVMAARKMFSRVAGVSPDAEKVAESAWSLASQQQLEADAQNATIARQRLDEIRSMKDEALRSRQAARSTLQDEQLRASAATPPEPFVPEPSPRMQTEGGTQVIPRAPDLSEPPPAAPGIEIPIQSPQAPVTQVLPGMRAGAGEAVAPDFAAAPSGIKPRTDYAEGASMSGQARGDQAMREMTARPAPAAPERTGIPGMLDELEAYQRSEKPLSSAAPGEVVTARPGAKPPNDLETTLAMMKRRVDAGHTLAQMREANTTELLGKGVAEEEAKLLDALHEFQNVKNEFVNKIVAGDNPRYFAPEVPRDFAAPSAPRAPATADEILNMRHEGRQVERTGVGKNKAIRALGDAHDVALERAQRSADPGEKALALQQADQLEKLLDHLHAPSVQRDQVPTDFLTELGDHAQVIDRYEQSSSKLADAVGDAAHPVTQATSKAYAAAENDAARKTTERATRAIEDHETFGPNQYAGPQYKTPKERVHYARERANEAGNAYTSASNEERAAKQAHTEARGKVAEGEKAKRTALKTDAMTARSAARTAKRIGIATAVGGGLEIANIPGIPKASDLPVVGPLLGTWLKYRALKAALGRVGGTVPARANNRVAALAAQTKDRIARAVDASIGLASKAAKTGYKIAPLAAGVVTQPIYDDGGPVPPKTASLPEHVAARTRELAAYVNTPNAIENDVRKQLVGVTDPDVITAAEQQRRTAMEYLLKNAPKVPQTGPLQREVFLPAPADAMSWARRAEAVNDPAGMYERIAAAEAQVSLEAADAMQNVYPKLFQMGQERILERSQDIKTSVPYIQRIRLSLIYKLPLDSSVDPDNFKITQSVFERSLSTAPAAQDAAARAMPAAPPVPSIAQPTNLNQLYMNPFDRQR